MFDITNLMTAEYFFNRAPGGDFLLGYPVLIFFVLVLFVKTFLYKKASQDKYFKKTIRKGFGKFKFLGVTGIILCLARFGDVPFFSMRFLLYVTLVATIVFLIKEGLRVKRDYKKRLDSVARAGK